MKARSEPINMHTKYNSFEQNKGLTWIDNYENILKWEREEVETLVPPVGISIDLTTSCNIHCRFCLTASTKILMSDFSIKEIKDIKVGDKVIGIDKNKKIIITEVTNTFKREYNGKLVNLYTEKGLLRVTPEHKIWHTRSRWKQAINFKKGNRINEIPSLNNIEINNEFKLGWLAGVCDGDGCFWSTTDTRKKNPRARRQFRLYMNDTEAYDRFESYFNELGFKGIYKNNYFHKGIYKREMPAQAIYLTKEENVNYFETKIHEIPENKTSYYIGYLSGIFDSEGSLSDVIRLAQIKEEIIKKITEALNYLSIPFIKEKKAFRLLGGLKTKIWFLNTMKPSITRKYSKIYGKRLSAVGKITNTELEDFNGLVYNIETKSNNYLANGIFVHNCNAERSWALGKHLTFEEVKAIIDLFYEWREEYGGKNCRYLRSVCFGGGGEPTTHPHYADIIEYAKTKGFEVGTSTNGVLLSNPKIRTALIKYADFCGVSINAATAATWSSLTRMPPHMFDTIMDNCKLYLKEWKETDRFPRKLDIPYKFLISQFNQHEILAAAINAKAMGFPSVYIRPAAVEGFEIFEGKNHTFDIELINKQLEEAKKLEDDNFKVFTSLMRVDSQFKKVLRFDKCHSTPCLIQVCADGFIYHCIDARHLEHSKLCHWKSIRKYWSSDEHRQHVKHIDLSKCSRCASANYNEQIQAIETDSMYRWFP